MLRWSLIFLITSLIAALFGFCLSIDVAKVLFFVFLVLFLITLIAGSSMVKRK